MEVHPCIYASMRLHIVVSTTTKTLIVDTKTTSQIVNLDENCCVAESIVAESGKHFQHIKSVVNFTKQRHKKIGALVYFSR